jgi:hypothetical protein
MMTSSRPSVGREGAMSGKKADVKWSDIKRQLQSLEERDLVALIQGLFKLAVENRAFLAARVLGASAGQALLPPYRERIERAFYTRGGRPQLKLAEGRKAIREYQAATEDPAGSLELMMTFVETGTRFTSEFGDIDEPFYNSLSSVLHEMDRILKSEQGPELYQGIRERVLALPKLAGRIGWGYGDEIRERVAAWEQRFGEE